ncbi:dephospho-CoA kinase Cab5p [[Candida] anglica]|uniref:Dephospho-CoA kinase Cab5p n=1 Tax=[Candida] anglica TaxID=148631 RepID=A0ABP0E8X3_9ASCO
MLIVGLTGGIASGKSTVSRTLQDKHHLIVVDADQIAKDVVQPGKPAYNQVVNTFKDQVPDIVDEETKALNRAALGRAVFGNKDNLKKLNSIVHPAVKKEIGWQIIKAFFQFQKLVILDVPLLFEAGLNVVCGKIITVSCDPSIQLERLLLRNPELSQQDAEKRISSQTSNAERNLRSDIVLNNDGSLQDLQDAIEVGLTEIMPSIFWTIVNFIPGVCVLTSAYTFATRATIDTYKRSKLRKES